MSKWIKVAEPTFNSHLELFENVRSIMAEDGSHVVYYIVNDTGQQWVGKVTDDGHYIATT